jgi:hypothetical protein
MIGDPIANAKMAASSMTEDRVLPSFISRSSPGFLPSLVAMLPGVMTIAPCCGGDYQGQNHRSAMQ